MKVSIVTAVFNEASTLDATLESLERQIFSGDVELIVVDGFSDDNTPDVLARHKSMITKVIRHERRGVYDAINAGLHCATGDIVGILHGNDRMASPRVLQHIADAFAADSGLDFVYGNVVYAAPGSERIIRRYDCRRFSPRLVAYGCCPPHPSLYIRLGAMRDIGDYSTRYSICGDFDMWIRLFANGRFHHKYIDEDIVVMSPGGLSGTWRARLWRNNVERMAVLRDNGLPASFGRLLMKYWIMNR